MNSFNSPKAIRAAMKAYETLTSLENQFLAARASYLESRGWSRRTMPIGFEVHYQKKRGSRVYVCTAESAVVMQGRWDRSYRNADLIKELKSN